MVPGIASGLPRGFRVPGVVGFSEFLPGVKRGSAQACGFLGFQKGGGVVGLPVRDVGVLDRGCFGSPLVPGFCGAGSAAIPLSFGPNGLAAVLGFRDARKLRMQHPEILLSHVSKTKQ